MLQIFDLYKMRKSPWSLNEWYLLGNRGHWI